MAQKESKTYRFDPELIDMIKQAVEDSPRRTTRTQWLQEAALDKLVADGALSQELADDIRRRI